MIIYSVSCTLPATLSEEWETFFLEKHLKDVVNTGYFQGYSFRKEEQEAGVNEVTYVSEYYCADMEQLNAYQANAAAAMKKDVLDKFGGQFTAFRKVYTMLHQSQNS